MSNKKSQSEKDQELVLNFIKSSSEFLVALANRNEINLDFNLKDNIKKLKSKKNKEEKVKTKK
jgi:hypothetical protein